MLRFLNELDSFRKSIEVKSKTQKRSKSRIAHSERHRDRVNNTHSDLPSQIATRPLREQQSFCCNTQRNQEAPIVSRKNSKRRRCSKKNTARRLNQHQNKENMEIRIEEDAGESSPPSTNQQLISNSTKVRNEIRARISEAYNRNNDYFQKQMVRERFMKTLTTVYRCLKMLPVINEQCIIGTIGQPMYYFLGKVLFQMLKLKYVDLTINQFLKQCQPIFDKASASEVESLIAATSSTIGNQHTHMSLGSEPPVRSPTTINHTNNTLAFDCESYLLREENSINSSSTRKRTTNASLIRESHLRQEPQQAPSQDQLRLRNSSRQRKLRRKNSYHFDRQQVIEEESAIGKLNDRLQEYIAKHHLRRE